MSSYVKAFLELEITIIPQIMDTYIGKYYNNALYNGITWMIFILHVIHFVFDISVNALLKKMRFKEYVRIRLRKSLWYLGFYTCSFLYCTAILWKNSINKPHRHKFQILDLSEPISGHLILGYVLLCSFYASSSMWEGFQCSISSFAYLFLTGFAAFTYFLRYIELVFLLTGSFSAVYMVTEFSRCLFCVIKRDFGSLDLIVRIIFCLSILTFAVVYFAVIPFHYVLPLGRGFFKNPNSIILAGLNVSIWGWFICEVYGSPLYRLIQHRWRHCENEKVPECLGSKMECALFLPRDDVAYNLKIIKKEIKERQARMVALRKPKRGANMLMQTLKCVAAINRKIKYRNLLARGSQMSEDLTVNKSEEYGQRTADAEIVLQEDVLEDADETVTSKEDTEFISSIVTESISCTPNHSSLQTGANEENRNPLLDLKVQFVGIVEEENHEEMDNGDNNNSDNSSEIKKP